MSAGEVDPRWEPLDTLIMGWDSLEGELRLRWEDRRWVAEITDGQGRPMLRRRHRLAHEAIAALTTAVQERR